MKLKKGIGVSICCLAVMGMLSFGGLHAKAVACDHTYLQSQAEVYKEPGYDSIGHYDVYGDKHSCPRCGYVRWENLHIKRTTAHSFTTILTEEGYKEKCISCGYTK